MQLNLDGPSKMIDNETSVLQHLENLIPHIKLISL